MVHFHSQMLIVILLHLVLLSHAAIPNDYVFTSQSSVPSLSSWSIRHPVQFEGDNSPNIQVTLPFTFPYWGSQINSVYLNPNGIAQLSQSNICCRSCTPTFDCCEFIRYPNPFGASECSFASNYHNLLAVCATDFDPLRNVVSSTTISWGQLEILSNPQGAFVIVWQNMPLKIGANANITAGGLLDPTNVLYTFGIGLYPSGRIDYYYFNVSDPVQYAGWGTADRRPWLVGLKQPAGQSQMNALASQWADPNTQQLPGNGTFVPRSLVQPSTTITFFPIGSSMCLSPTVSPMTGNISLRIVVKDYLVTTSISSASMFSWSCRFRVQSTQVVIATVPAEYNVVQKEIRCLTPAFSINGTAIEVLLLADGIVLPMKRTTIRYERGPQSLITAITQPINTFASLSLFCAECSEYRPEICWTDCAGVLNGQAYLDECNVCVGGTTGLTRGVTLDCMGICDGPFRYDELSGVRECVCRGDVPGCFSLMRTPTYLTSANYQYVYSLPGEPVYTLNNEPVIQFNDSRFVPLNMIPTSPGSSTFSRLTMPFEFPYFNSRVSVIFVSAWGAVVLGYSSAACMTNLASNAIDQGSGCEYDMIAGYLGQYEIGGSRYATLVSSNVVAIRYSGIRLLNAPANATQLQFMISMYPSGRVAIEYDTWISPDDALQLTGRRVLAGLMSRTRSASEFNFVYPSKFNEAISRSTMGLYSLITEQEWRTAWQSSGIFIPRARMSRNGRYVFYPMGINMCAAPYYGSNVGGQIVHLNVGRVSAYMQVLAPAFTCVFGSRSVPVVYNTTYESYSCIAPSFSSSNVGVPLALHFHGIPVNTNRMYYLFYHPASDPVQPSIYARQYFTAALCNQCYSPDLQVNTAWCYLDCHNSWRGSAVQDDCGACVGGLTGLFANYAKDCYGTCYGGHTRQSLIIANTSVTQCACSMSEIECRRVPSAYPTPVVRVQYIDTATPSSTSDSVVADAITSMFRLSVRTALSFTSPRQLITVTLPFTFSYFGSPTNHLYVSALGAIYMWNVSSECVANEFSSVDRSTFTPDSDCIYSLIAPANAAFDIANAQVLVYSNDDRVVIHWLALRVPSAREPFDFAAIISSDQSVVTLFNKMSDPAIATYNRSAPLLLGLRLGVASSIMQFPMFYSRISYNGLCGRFQGCTYATVSASTVSRTEIMYLPSARATSGYYPDRLALFDQVTGDALFDSISYCPLSTGSCLSPRWGDPNGGTQVLVVQPSLGCVNSSLCCALAMNVTCNFGNVRVPARYDVELGGWRCVAPAGIEGMYVSVWLEESGRRIGSIDKLLFEYKRNGSELMPITKTDYELRLCRDCNAALRNYCTIDCSGTYRGNATLDDCGVCKAPATTGAVTFVSFVKTLATFSYVSARDCLGSCYGPFKLYNDTSPLSTFPRHADLPQCGCTTPSPGAVAQRSGFPWSSVCWVWQRHAQSDALTTTVEPLSDYQRFLLALAASGLFVALAFQLKYTGTRIYRRMKMTPADREREARRRERRRNRERERRARRRALEQGLPLPGELAPGQAARPAALPIDLMDDDTATATVASPTSNSLAQPSASTNIITPLQLSARSSDAPTDSELDALQQLAGMGFTDQNRCVTLLRRHRGDVNIVLNELLR